MVATRSDNRGNRAVIGLALKPSRRGRIAREQSPNICQFRPDHVLSGQNDVPPGRVRMATDPLGGYPLSNPPAA